MSTAATASPMAIAVDSATDSTDSPLLNSLTASEKASDTASSAISTLCVVTEEEERDSPPREFAEEVVEPPPRDSAWLEDLAERGEFRFSEENSGLLRASLVLSMPTNKTVATS